MGSQTLEILRQGVWASLTGGWFYDPHQNVFCNAIHLYLWLFLLCTPFITYLYFPTTLATWGAYCVATTLTITVLKIINMHLHKLYDRAQAMSESNLKNPFKDSKEIEGEDECGIEMQVLGADMTSKTSVDQTLHPISDANSMVSAENVNSTIDLKVDVHRKNSSESCDSISYFPSTLTSIDSHPTAAATQTTTQKYSKDFHDETSASASATAADACQPPPPHYRNPLVRKNDTIKRNRRLKSRIERQSSLDSAPNDLKLPRNATVIPCDTAAVAAATAANRFKPRLQRHRSSETHDERHNRNLFLPIHHERNELEERARSELQSWMLGSSDMYLEDSYTKSDLGIEQIDNSRNSSGKKNFHLLHGHHHHHHNHHQRTPMRKDSNSTMSALQLPVAFGNGHTSKMGGSATATAATNGGGAASGMKKRRHSSASKNDNSTNVRRIKSTALETACAHPSVSNLPTHPNSIEAISSGQTQTTMALPPLVRNPHLNLCPKFGSFTEMVYPIVELADEKSLNEVYVMDNFEGYDGENEKDDDDNDDDIDDEDGAKAHAATTESESEIDRPIAHSTDSETDNNGSRSPLLTKLRNNTNTTATTTTTTTTTKPPPQDDDDVVVAEKEVKNLGAIPKTVKPPPAEPQPQQNRSATPYNKTLSRTSSSSASSSRSFSVESDIYRTQRELWIMYGAGPAGAGIASTSTQQQHPFYSDIVTNYRMPAKRSDPPAAATSNDAITSVENSTTLSIQGLMMGDRHHHRGVDAAATDSVYCDYWRPAPAASLAAEKPTLARRFYKYRVNVCGTRHEFKIEMDRLQLLALFDRDLSWLHVAVAIALCGCVCALGATVLQLSVYKDVFAFLFCLVIAGSQYSLVKSVQPDAASPVHGFNKTVAYSRPIYFCLCSTLLITFNNQVGAVSHVATKQSLQIFGTDVAADVLFRQLTQCMAMLLLVFPILFSLGLFPQINTFSMYFLEQVDMHIFGGNATSSLAAAILCVLRSVAAVSLLYGPAYGGLYDAKATQHISFSVFCALLIPIGYHLSRSASDFTHIWVLIKTAIVTEEDEPLPTAAAVKESSTENIVDGGETEMSTNTAATGSTTTATIECNPEPDPLPKKLQSTVNARLKNDCVVATLLALAIFGLHCSTIFTVLQPDLNTVLYAMAAVVGVVLHYVLPQLRKHMPWLCFAKPILRQGEFGQFEVADAALVMWFEKIIVYLGFFERNVLYPLIFISALTADSQAIVRKFGLGWGTAIVTVCGLKCVRSSYSDSANQFLILIFTVLFFKCDFAFASESFLVDYFFLSLAYRKFCDFLLKLQFIVTYIAPWQITWGSAFHAFAQPFSVPHSAMLFLQAAVSSVLSTPLNPFLGSAIFLTSYVRPIKFWERDYNTRRIDHSNTRLSSQLERDLGADDNNLNSIFYEHLTRSLQHSLCGDLLLGRWGNVNQGDCFVLASDYLNCLVHIIELGNGLCTFQMRGLEFRGTYCQQREVEAISEGVEDNDGCCCCSPGHLPQMLSVNAMFSTRWLAWQVVAAQYVLEGYSISENLATATLQVFEFRKVLITYYIKTIIYYVTRNPKLEKWLASEPIKEALAATLSRQFADLDPIFNYNLDEDFDCRAVGITRTSFCSIYLSWIQFCYGRRAADDDDVQKCDTSGTAKTPLKTETKEEEKSENITKDSPLVSLCLALGLLARRTLATATHSSLSGVEFFLHGLHALFKGDFRITSPRDEWVFADMELLHGVVAPAVKMALKLHQDHFSSPDEYLDPSVLYDAITANSHDLVISHEADPIWRSAVLRGAPNLLALRHVLEDGSDEYRIIRLTKRFLSFRVIKLNRECVRGLWSGQQQELIYLRNRNPERGSIQNAKQALRNIINSSCDQPIGYPIYVSPLTTSYADTNRQLCRIVGGAITIDAIRCLALKCWRRVRERCREGCSSGSSSVEMAPNDLPSVYFSPTPLNANATGVVGIGPTVSYGSQSLSGAGGGGGRAGGCGSLASMLNKPTSSTLLAGLLNREREQEREAVRATRKIATRTSADRERRATLPITSSVVTGGSRDLILKDSMGSTNSGLRQLDFAADAASQSTKISSAGNLGGHHRMISKCNTADSLQTPAAAAAAAVAAAKLNVTKSEECNLAGGGEAPREVVVPTPSIEINKKVIIVDELEIFDCLDLGRRLHVIWPSEKWRSNGGRLCWNDWSPKEGMVGRIVHQWLPNHADQRQRSHVNEIVHLIEIGERYVPVGERGIREYNQPSEEEVEEEEKEETNERGSNTFIDIPLDKTSGSGSIGGGGESGSSCSLQFIVE